jgi:hypothetical protein
MSTESEVQNQNTEAQYATQANLISCIVTNNKGVELPPLNGDMILGFIHRESLVSPFMSGVLAISDSADFLNGLDMDGNQSPIEGGEIVKITVKTPVSQSEDGETYEYKIWKIGNRISINKKQAYALALVSEEALLNETTRVLGRIPSGGQNAEEVPEKSISDIVYDLVKTKIGLESSKPLFREPTKFKQVIIGARRRPFDIISSLSEKAVSTKGKTGNTTNSSSDASETKETIKGTAGFFFWETKRGYNFFSVDALCDEPDGIFAAPDLKSEIHTGYQEKIANAEGVDTRSVISKITFTSEIDTMSALRKGKYSSTMIFFNISTGQYEEYQYKITDSYDNMAHLGNQTKVSELKVGEQQLVETPSRLMTMILDHETWFNEPGVASPYENASNPSVFADWHKHFAAQSVARKELLNNQQCTVEIPGNNEICAGDKVEIRVQRKAPDKVREEEPWDLESSGVYLVKDVEHRFNFADGTSGKVVTTLQLFRDSFGVKDTDTKRGE